MLLAVAPIAERERKRNKQGHSKKVKAMKVTFKKRKKKEAKRWRVNKKADIPVYVKKYLEDVKNPASTGDIYNYGLEHGAFGVYTPKSKKAMASQIVGRCKNQVCYAIPQGNSVLWGLIEEEA